ncbi:MAG: PulJ/GspJ family protein [Thermodesulfovibrionales bacterium]
MNLRNDRGLTIVELILALSFSIVVVVILFSALRLAYKSQEKGISKTEALQKVRIISDRITWLIRGAYPYSRLISGKERLYFQGKSDSLGFVTSSVDNDAAGPLEKAGLKWVRLYHDREGLKTNENIFFSEDALEEKGGKTYTLDPSVRKISFAYYDLPEDKKTGEWVTDWDPEEKMYMPSAVRITILYEEKGQETAMPELVVSIHTQKKMP